MKHKTKPPHTPAVDQDRARRVERVLFITCIKTGTSSLGSALATETTVLKPLSQKTRLPRLHRNLCQSRSTPPIKSRNRKEEEEKKKTHAVRLFTKVICAKDNRSALAPALSRSEKWSSTDDMALEWKEGSGPSVKSGQHLTRRWEKPTYPQSICWQNLTMPAAKPWQFCARFCTAPRGTSYFLATTCTGISLQRSRSWNAA